jgi:4-diphosphocytidyl-2-C-methyl-D-erythritol kinase
VAKEPERVCIIEAPCKINLHLSVGEKRPDGFHNLESLFASLALSDTLTFECSGKDGACLLSLTWKRNGESISSEKNLVFKAVSLFRERTGYKSGLGIHLDKRIPIGAGLGGGSSDAASTLLALNLLSGASLSMEELTEMATLLGSDVPFFLTGGAAFVSGRGERIEPVGAQSIFSHGKTPRGSFPNRDTALAGLWVVLVKPPFPSDTEFAYRTLDEARAGKGAEKRERLSKEVLIRSLEEDPITWPFYNDFLPVFLDPRFCMNSGDNTQPAVYRAILETLREWGASFAGLSGAGSCCFGIFNARETAEMAAKFLSNQENRAASSTPGQGNFINLTFFLAHRANPVLQY